MTTNAATFQQTLNAISEPAIRIRLSALTNILSIVLDYV